MQVERRNIIVDGGEESLYFFSLFCIRFVGGFIITRVIDDVQLCVSFTGHHFQMFVPAGRVFKF